MGTPGQAVAGERTGVHSLTGWLGQHPLFLEIQQRPGLLLRELAWRWVCGSLLLAMAGFAAWRVWVAALPALSATGILLLTPDTLMDSLPADPARLAATLQAGFDLLRPPLEHAAAGLAPLAVFLWVGAFAWGRARVLAAFDRRLPRRPWLLAESEGLRIVVLFGSAAAWFGGVRAAYALFFQGADGHVLLYLISLAGLTWVYLWFTGRFRRAQSIATVISLVKGPPFLSALHRAWRLDEHYKIVPLRKAVGRVRMYLLLAGLVLALVPAPFALGWPLVVWWLLLSLPPLAAADAWRLGAWFALIRTLQDAQTRP